MKNLKIIIAAVILISFNGCLLFHKVSYDVKLDSPNKGTAYVTFYDIRSDATSTSMFEEDKNNLFNFILKGDQFLTEIKKEGKNVVSRELEVSGDTLIGKAVFKFDDISAVERIVYEDGFYYLTLPLEDSVITTNGEIIQSKQYKRILWDKSIKNLKFEIFSTDFKDGSYKGLAEYYKK